MYVEIPDEMIECEADTALERIEVISAAEGVYTRYIGLPKYESILLEASLHFSFFPWFDPDSSGDSLLERC